MSSRLSSSALPSRWIEQGNLGDLEPYNHYPSSSISKKQKLLRVDIQNGSTFRFDRPMFPP